MNLYHNLLESFAKTRLGGWMFLNVFNPIDKRLMSWTNGRVNLGVGTDFHKNTVLLTCKGARSGKTFEVPLLATPYDDGYVLIASRGGHAKNPSWYYNLKANPDCSLVVPKKGRMSFTAREAEGDERERAWSAANENYSGYNTYQKRTERTVPVVVLDPAD